MTIVIPAQAGIHALPKMDPGLRRDDIKKEQQHGTHRNR